MAVRDLTEHAGGLVQEALADSGEPEVERLLVGDALVSRDGNHYRIESGGDDDTELAAGVHRPTGLCDCGAPLSAYADHQRCRTCGREYRSS